MWFDSGASSLGVLEPRGLPYPADIYLEGGDQFRGWFNSSFVIGLATKGQPPYQRRDHERLGRGRSEARKCPSRKGDAVAPEKIIKQSGAEIIRLWCAALDYHEDMRISNEILTRLSDAYRKIRNTARYCLGNLDGFDPATDKVPFEEMQEIDQWAVIATNELVKNCTEAYERYDFMEVYQAIYHNATVTLSSLYFDILKDRLYTAAPKSLERRSAQTALYEVVDTRCQISCTIAGFHFR